MRSLSTAAATYGSDTGEIVVVVCGVDVDWREPRIDGVLHRSLGLIAQIAIPQTKHKRM